MDKKVEMRFSIQVRGSMGGSFTVDKADYEKLRKKWEGGSGCRHDDTDLAEELLALAPFNYFDHLIVDEMEIQDLDEKK